MSNNINEKEIKVEVHIGFFPGRNVIVDIDIDNLIMRCFEEIESIDKKINNLLKDILNISISTSVLFRYTNITYNIKNEPIYFDFFFSIIKKILNIYKIICDEINTLDREKGSGVSCSIKIITDDKTTEVLEISYTYLSGFYTRNTIFDYKSFYVITHESFDKFISIYKLKCDNITKEVFEKILSMCMNITKIPIRYDSLKNYINYLIKKYDVNTNAELCIWFSYNEEQNAVRTTLEKLIDVIDDILKLSDDFILRLDFRSNINPTINFKITVPENEDEKNKLMKIINNIAKR